MEHVVDFKTHPLVPPQRRFAKRPVARARLTPAEIKELVEYAGKYYIHSSPSSRLLGIFINF